MIGTLPKFIAEPDPEIYLGDNYVAVDFETTTNYYGSSVEGENRIVCAVWKYGAGHPSYDRDRVLYDIPAGLPNIRYARAGEYELGALVSDIEQADFLVAHNSKFELGWLLRCGLDLSRSLSFCTQLGEYVLGGNTHKLQHLSLAECLARRKMKGKVDLVSKMIKQGIPVEDIPESWLRDYCLVDVEQTEALFLRMRQELHEAGKLPVAYLRNCLTPVLVDMEANGLQLDKSLVDPLVAEADHTVCKLEAELQDMMGGMQPSGDDLVNWLYDPEKGNFDIPVDWKRKPMLTPGGKPSAAAPVLERLKPKNAKQRIWLDKFQEYRSAATQLSKVLFNFKECCDKAGGLLHGQFNQCNTGTHRLSSSGIRFGVQLQNLNRSFKPIFTARHPGWLVGEADGAQLEFRVAAHCGRDRQALHDIVAGVDVHAFTSRVLSEAGQPTDRQGAKAHTFKPLYGGGSGTDAERTYYSAFKEKYHSIAETQERWVQTVWQHRKLKLESGLEFFWPGAEADPKTGYVYFTTQICNYPVQNLATAEIIPWGLICAWHRIKSAGLKMFLVNTVHDSIIAEMPPEEVEDWHKLAQVALIDDVYAGMKSLYGMDITVPLGAGVMVGSHWSNSEAKESETVYTARDELWKEAAIAEGMIDG